MTLQSDGGEATFLWTLLYLMALLGALIWVIRKDFKGDD